LERFIQGPLPVERTKVLKNGDCGSCARYQSDLVVVFVNRTSNVIELSGDWSAATTEIVAESPEVIAHKAMIDISNLIKAIFI
jgi:hypothetical protein